MSKLSVFGPVDRGGGAHSAEAVEETEQEENEALAWRADGLAFKRSVLQTTTDIELVAPAEVGGESAGGPDGGCGEEAGEDWRRGGFRAADNRDGSAVEGSDRGGFFGGVAEPLAGEGRFNFEHGVDAFGGQVESRGVREQRRCVEVVEDGDVDLTGTATGGVDYECGGGSVTLGEVAIEKLKPVLLGGVTHCRRMFEESTDGELREHFLLDTAEDLGEVDMAGVGWAGQ